MPATPHAQDTELIKTNRKQIERESRFIMKKEKKTIEREQTWHRSAGYILVDWSGIEPEASTMPR